MSQQDTATASQQDRTPIESKKLRILTNPHQDYIKLQPANLPKACQINPSQVAKKALINP